MHDVLTRWAQTSAARAQRLGRDERGASFVEYAMLLALVVVVCVAAVTMVGATTGESLSSTASRLP